jgi:molybdopterin-binding protein
MGQSVYKVTTGAVNNEITIQPIAALSKGVYIVSIKNEASVFTQKISVP